MPDLAYGEVYAMSREEARQRLVRTYQEMGNISETARRWHTSRQVVRKWVSRFRAEGEVGLEDRSRRPHHSPRRTAPELEEQVVESRQATGYGPRRLALYLHRQGVHLSPHTIRHILKRHGLVRCHQRRRTLYPAHWAWEVEKPFTLLQADVKDILDKGALGTERWDHLRKQHLPRYQWGACEARSRLRLLAYSHRNNRNNGMAFLILTLLWLRACGVSEPVTFQTDWGVEFGGDNPERIASLSERFLAPLDGDLKRYPMGRKQYNGRVERSHRADDEEFYRPYLLQLPDTDQFLQVATRWLYFYNVLRPHLGAGMEGEPPLADLQRLGYNGKEQIALFPPLLLDDISADLLLACDP